MFYIYILYSQSSNKYYIGQTQDPSKRLKEHNTKENGTYTSKHQPWELMAVFEIGTSLSEALATERFIKKQKSRKIIEWLIDPQNIPEGKLTQLVRVPKLWD